MISVVVPVYNQLRYTKSFVDSLTETIHHLMFDSSEPVELIVIDNASEQDTVDYLYKVADIENRLMFLEVMIIRNEKNLGVAKALNQGIEASRGERIMLCNNDILFSPHWREKLLAFANSNKKIGGVGALIYDHMWGEDRWKRENDSGPPGEEDMVVEGIHASCWMMKREMVEDLKEKEKDEPNPGLFDERYYLTWEDVDYVYRAKKRGWDIMTIYNCPFYHFGNRTLNHHPDRNKHYIQGRGLFLTKHKLPYGPEWTVSMSVYKKEDQ